ncbi:MAG: hypothetical protein WAW86_10935 [Gammaproteobacteria bacterium]
MYKKLIIAISLIMIHPLCFAETCPTILALKHSALSDWKVYDSDDGKLVSAHRATEFKRIAQQFALAEWSKGKIHCYYRDKEGSDLEAYLAKDHFALSNNKNYWYEVSGFMHCAAGMNECEFEQMGKPKQQQFAKKAVSDITNTNEKI